MVGQKIAIDIGASNITIYSEGRGIVICEPCCIAEDAETGKEIAYGLKATAMAGREPKSVKIIRPVVNGRVNDYKRTVKILSEYFKSLCRGRIFRPNILMCVSGNVTPLERKTLYDAVIEAGAGNVAFTDGTLAAAIGAGVSIDRPEGVFICDIGASSTDCAVIAGGRIAEKICLNTGGNDFNRCLREYIFREKNAEISDETAESVKKEIGSAIKRDEEIALEITGKDIFNFCLRNFEVTSNDVITAFSSPLKEIGSSVRVVLESITPELSADVFDYGIILTGGGAGIYGLDKMLESITGVKTISAESPDLCAALGMGHLLDRIKKMPKDELFFND